MYAIVTNLTCLLELSVGILGNKLADNILDWEVTNAMIRRLDSLCILYVDIVNFS
jgi:hypothetical protein